MTLMNNLLNNLAPCPKCNSYHTTDEKPSIDDFEPFPIEHPLLFEKGKARYYCIDCDHIWKKYRGKKPYSSIKWIEAFAGGFPGPSFKVKIDFEKDLVEHVEYHSMEQENDRWISDEEKDWLLSELYKCDFLNWSEEYFLMAMDGSHWSVKIEYDTHCEIKTGSNHFPPKWTKFRKAIEKISGGEFY
jgi:hypothetical protein